MKVYVDNFGGKNIGRIEVDYYDTVSVIKYKIWRRLRIPVSSQLLYFKSKMLYKDHAKAADLKIVPNSHLQVYFLPNRNHPTHKTNQVLQETKNSPAPSSSTQQIVHGHQDLPVGRKRSNNSQVLQTEQSPVLPSNSLGQDLSSMIKVPSVRPKTTQMISNVQDSPVMARSKNKQVLQTKQSPVPSEQPWTTEKIREVQSFLPERTNEIINSPSSSLSDIETLLGIQDCRPSVTVGSSSNTNQVFQTKQFSPGSLDFVKEILNISDSPAKKRINTSPMKLTKVMVKPTEDSWRIPVEVNADDNVKELRKELVKMQERGQINLPKEGFFLLHQDTILNENESFLSNEVIQCGTIEIFGEYFTSDDDSSTTRV